MLLDNQHTKREINNSTKKEKTVQVQVIE